MIGLVLHARFSVGVERVIYSAVGIVLEVVWCECCHTAGSGVSVGSLVVLY